MPPPAWHNACVSACMIEATATPATLSTPKLNPASAGEHLPLVWRVARQIARRLPANVDVAELVGAGTVGLIDAMNRYEVQRCDRFEGYAEIRIRGAILDQLREMDWMPRSARTKRKRLDATQAQLHNKLGRAPDADEVAKALGTTLAGVDRMRRDVQQADLVRNVDADGVVDGGVGPLGVLESRALRARLVVAIGALPVRHQQILSLYYVDDLKLREIGALLSVTESRVCQVVRDIVVRLRAAIIDD